MTRRQQWLRAVRSPSFPAKQRVLRGTLLMLPINADGSITATDDVIAETVGLPRRTLQWQLARAVETGWLERVQRGGYGHRVRFRVIVPGEDSTVVQCASFRALRAAGVRKKSAHSDGSGVRNMVALLNKRSANDREHVAVNGHRERRNNHDGARVEQPRHEHQRRSNRHPPARAAIAAGSLTACGLGPLGDDSLDERVHVSADLVQRDEQFVHVVEGHVPNGQSGAWIPRGCFGPPAKRVSPVGGEAPPAVDHVIATFEDAGKALHHSRDVQPQFRARDPRQLLRDGVDQCCDRPGMEAIVPPLNDRSEQRGHHGFDVGCGHHDLADYGVPVARRERHTPIFARTTSAMTGVAS